MLPYALVEQGAQKMAVRCCGASLKRRQRTDSLSLNAHLAISTLKSGYDGHNILRFGPEKRGREVLVLMPLLIQDGQLSI